MAFSAKQIRELAVKDVSIVGFDAEEPIVIKLKTLSLLGLVSSGKIPNLLLSTALTMFEGTDSKKKKDTPDDGTEMTDMGKLIDIICENSMVEPKFEEIADIITDAQKMEIFYYTQGGVKALESFRTEQKNHVALNNSAAAARKTK
jgi:hypothetical protein